MADFELFDDDLATDYIRQRLNDEGIHFDEDILDDLPSVIQKHDLDIESGITQFIAFIHNTGVTLVDKSTIDSWVQHHLSTQEAINNYQIKDTDETNGEMDDLVSDLPPLSTSTHPSSRYDTPSKSQKRTASTPISSSFALHFRSTPGSVSQSPYTATFTKHTSMSTVAAYEGQQFKQLSDFLMDADSSVSDKPNESTRRRIPLMNVSYINYLQRKRDQSMSTDEFKLSLVTQHYKYAPWDNTERDILITRITHILDSIISSRIFQHENPDFIPGRFKPWNTGRVSFDEQLYAGMITTPPASFTDIKARRDAKLTGDKIFFIGLNPNYISVSKPEQLQLITDQCSQYMLFPGQIVMFKGTRGSTYSPIQVMRLYTETTLPRWDRESLRREYSYLLSNRSKQLLTPANPIVPTIIIGSTTPPPSAVQSQPPSLTALSPLNDVVEDHTLRVVQATGPFIVQTSRDDCYTIAPVLELIKTRTHPTDYLVLMGPFIDSVAIPPTTTPTPSVSTNLPKPILSAPLYKPKPRDSDGTGVASSIDPNFNSVAKQSLFSKDVPVYITPSSTTSTASTTSTPSTPGVKTEEGVDVKPSMSMGNEDVYTHQDLFNNFLVKLQAQVLEDPELHRLRIITIPSPDDHHHYYHTYPQPAFPYPDGEDSPINRDVVIHLPNPCVFDVNGVLVAATNSGTLLDISSSSLYIAPVIPPHQQQQQQQHHHVLDVAGKENQPTNINIDTTNTDTTPVPGTPAKIAAQQPPSNTPAPVTSSIPKREDRFHRLISQILSQQCLSPCITLPFPKEPVKPQWREDDYFHKPLRPINNHALDEACKTSSYLRYKPDILLIPSVTQYRTDAVFLPGDGCSHAVLPLETESQGDAPRDNKVVVVNSECVAKGQRRGFCALITVRPNPRVDKGDKDDRMTDDDHHHDGKDRQNPLQSIDAGGGFAPTKQRPCPVADRTRVDIIQL